MTFPSGLSPYPSPGPHEGGVGDQARTRTSQRLAWNDPEIVSHRKDSGYRIGTDAGEVLVCLAVDDSLESYMTVPDNDADWLLHAQGIFLQGRESVDGAIQSQAQLVVFAQEISVDSIEVVPLRELIQLAGAPEGRQVVGITGRGF